MGGYRDEREGLRARVEALEEELAASRATVAELRGETARAPDAGDERSALTGTTSRMVRERVLPFELDAESYEEIAALLRTRLGLQVAQVGRTLTGTAPSAAARTPAVSAFTLREGGGETRLRLEGDFRALGGGVVAVPLLATLFTSLLSVGLLADIAGPAGAPMLLVAGLAPLAALGSGAWARRRARRRADALRATHEDVLAAIVAVAEAHAVPPKGAPTPVVRVADEAEPVEERPPEGAAARSERRS